MSKNNRSASLETEAQAQALTPDPALKRLDRLVGTWTVKGHLIGSDEENIIGKTTFQWLAGGFFMQQDIEMDFAGMMKIKSRELIGYDPQTKAFASTVYSNLSPTPLPYKWDLENDILRISVSYGPVDATFKGKFSKNGKRFSGGWRPNPGADETINVPYDIEGTRAE
jgi:hypothetical protein